MDRQGLYVATSRSRGQTYLYATPELRSERIEIAPGQSAQGLEHIARAAERDGSQASAHDAALRERLGGLPSADLHARRAELASEVRAESHNEGDRDRVEVELSEMEQRLEWVQGELRDLGPEPSRFSGRSAREGYARQHGNLSRQEESLREEIVAARAERAQLPSAAYEARAEVAVIGHLLSERLRDRVHAAQLDPPPYIATELGERPVDPRERQAWDRGAGAIEGFRAKHGIADKESAFGVEPGRERSTGERGSTFERSQQLDRESARRQVREAQRKLERVQSKVIEADRGADLSMGR